MSFGAPRWLPGWLVPALGEVTGGDPNKHLLDPAWTLGSSPFAWCHLTATAETCYLLYSELEGGKC